MCCDIFPKQKPWFNRNPVHTQRKELGLPLRGGIVYKISTYALEKVITLANLKVLEIMARTTSHNKI